MNSIREIIISPLYKTSYSITQITFRMESENRNLYPVIFVKDIKENKKACKNYLEKFHDPLKLVMKYRESLKRSKKFHNPQI